MSFTTPVLSYGLIVLAVLVLGLIGWIIYLQIRLIRLQRHYATLTEGTEAGNLEQVLEQHIGQVRFHNEMVTEIKAKTRRIDRTLKHSMQWMGLIRFNPFRNTGGNQSFSWAIVDGNGNGIVISSLYARDGTRVYAKPLSKWESPYSLTDEEKQAIARAYQQQT